MDSTKRTTQDGKSKSGGPQEITPSNLIDCPSCNGTGQQKVTVHDEKNNISTFEIRCLNCSGFKKVDAEEQRQKELEAKRFWCQCRKSSGATYFADGEGVIAKHHWVCNDCGKVAQVG